VGYRATVHVEALARPRLLADVTAVFAGAGVDIVAAVVEPPRELGVRHTYTVTLPRAQALPGLMRSLLRVPGVYDVYRGSRRAEQRGGRRAGEGGAEGRNRGDREAPAVRPSSGIRGGSAAFSLE
jgi:GTP pyrophosphokinase